jgi:hypothetical protein
MKATPQQKEKLKQVILMAQQTKGTNYFKTLIEGNTGIYFAHPYYGHSDYNKGRIFDKTPETLRLMAIFNRIVKP